MKAMKKALTFVLSIIMVMSLAVPAFASEAAPEYPTIYVTGAKTNNIYLDGEKVFPKNVDEMGIIKEALAPCFKKLAEGLVTGNYQPYVDEFYNAMAPMFEGATLDKNGEPSNGSSPEYHSSTVDVSDAQGGYDIWSFRFWYDWRLSPVQIASEMKAYIDRVITTTGKPKVQLVGRCLGANMIAAYLHYNKEHAKQYVSDVSYFASSAWGIDYMSAIYTGDFVLDPVAIDNFLNYYMENGDLIDDEDTSLLILTMVEFFRQVKVLGVAGESLVKLVDLFKGELIPKIVRETLGSWPSYWAMVTEECYEDARDFIYKGLEDEYEGMIKKIDKYHYEVQKNLITDMKELKEAGVNFCIFAKYGFPEIPVYEGATAQSDTSTTLYRQSFGATSADYGKILDEEYIASVKDKKYISPDKVIDGSTCLFPETTWYIRDLHHDDFGQLHDPVLEIMRFDLDGDSEKYPRFLRNVNGGLQPADENKEAVKEEDNIFASAIRFFTAIINFIIKLIKK